MINSVIQLLKKNSLKVTQNRVDILLAFISSEKAFALSDLEKKFNLIHDRSSIYRSLKTFSEKAILEKFHNASGITMFVFNRHKPGCNGDSHFKCNHCENVVTLPDLPKEYLEKLGNKKTEAINLLIEGTCEKCLNQS
jgi:Fur family ferric uptake transcriptional regulator